MGRQNRRIRHLAFARSKRKISKRFAETVLVDTSEHDDESEPEIVIPEESLDEESVQCAYVTVLKWKDDARLKRVPVNLGLSQRTKYRRLQEKTERLQSVRGYQPITKWFPRSYKESSDCEKPPEVNAPTSHYAPELRVPSFQEMIDQALTVLHPLTVLVSNQRIDKRLQDISKYDFVRLRAVKRFFEKTRDSPKNKISASLQIACELFPEGNSEWKARSIRQWATYFLANSKLPELKSGRHQKVSSLIDCEDVQNECLQWLRTANPNMVHSRSFSEWVQTQLHIRLDNPEPVNLSDRQARRWLNRLGFEYRQHQQCHNVDGHERDDVVRYRKKFLDRMAEYEKRMLKFVGDDCEVGFRPDLEEAVRPLVLVVQDESCFASYEGRKTLWMRKDGSVLRPKGAGRSIMVSEFLCECHGRMKLTEQQKLEFPDVPHEATVIINPGKNHDGYWDCEDLVSQTSLKAIPIFKILHPESDALFVFDNSSGHLAYAPDALIANRLNLSDGGANVSPMRSGWFFNEKGERVEQCMVTEDGIPKGLKTILIERNLWSSGLKKDDAKNC